MKVVLKELTVTNFDKLTFDRSGSGHSTGVGLTKCVKVIVRPWKNLSHKFKMYSQWYHWKWANASCGCSIRVSGGAASRRVRAAAPRRADRRRGAARQSPAAVLARRAPAPAPAPPLGLVRSHSPPMRARREQCFPWTGAYWTCDTVQCSTRSLQNWTTLLYPSSECNLKCLLSNC